MPREHIRRRSSVQAFRLETRWRGPCFVYCVDDASPSKDRTHLVRNSPMLFSLRHLFSEVSDDYHYRRGASTHHHLGYPYGAVRGKAFEFAFPAAQGYP